MTSKCSICASKGVCPGCGANAKCKCVFLDFLETTDGTTTPVSKVEPEIRRIESALFPKDVPKYIVLFRCRKPLGNGETIDTIDFHVHYESGGYVTSGSTQQTLDERTFHV